MKKDKKVSIKVKRDQTVEKKSRRKLYEKYGYLIGSKTEEIPEAHRCVTGGLRCFRRVVPRDDNGNPITSLDKIRCGRPCSKGSLYCSHHGGANAKALVHGARATSTLDVYKGIHSVGIQDLMDKFINDPKLLDQKAELVMVRTIMTNYIKKITEGRKMPNNAHGKIRLIREILDNDEFKAVDKLLSIKEVTDSIRDLDDGAVIDRINRCVETVGKTIDRIHKMETKEDYMLTPEGLKIILRCVLDILKNKIQDQLILSSIRQELLEISTKTRGDLSKFGEMQVSQVVDVTPRVASHGD